jgi:spoIIIJ-associated protein
MRTFEFEGKNTEDAIQEACRALHISKDDVEIEVLEPGSAGIFGLVGGRKAKIKVTLREEESAAPSIEAAVAEEDVVFAQETLQHILERIPVETTVHAKKTDGRIALSIEGDTSGLLIGRKGRTLDALQFIVNKIANKALDRRVHIVIDSENYRERRQESLIQMALRLGDKAKRIRKPVTTGPLNPHDRRIVHLALRDDEEVETRSRGEGVTKRVVIIPKRQPDPPR